MTPVYRAIACAALAAGLIGGAAADTPRSASFISVDSFSKQADLFRLTYVLGVADGLSASLNVHSPQLYKTWKTCADRLNSRALLGVVDAYMDKNPTTVPQSAAEVAAKALSGLCGIDLLRAQ
ncbi:hypothetical protein [Achromobacter sp. AGC39]